MLLLFYYLSITLIKEKFSRVSLSLEDRFSSIFSCFSPTLSVAHRTEVTNVIIMKNII